MVLGRRDEAYGLYEELRAELGSMVVDVRWAPSCSHLAELAVEFDDATTAELLAVHLRAWRHGRARSARRPPTSPGRRCATSAGWPRSPDGWTRPRSCCAAAVRRNLALRARPYVALSRLDLADVLYRTGSLGEAAALARQAADDLRRLEMPGPLARADRLASAAIARARDDADPLSA